GSDVRLDTVTTAVGTLRMAATRPEARLVRVPDACTAADRQAVWFGPYASTGTTYDVDGGFTPSMADALADPFISNGMDNVFVNDPTMQACNDIERVDLLNAPFTVVDAVKDGYFVAERGGNDAFGIAAVTGVDAAGNPTSFGPMYQAGTSGWG